MNTEQFERKNKNKGKERERYDDELGNVIRYVMGHFRRNAGWLRKMPTRMSYAHQTFLSLILARNVNVSGKNFTLVLLFNICYLSIFALKQNKEGG